MYPRRSSAMLVGTGWAGIASGNEQNGAGDGHPASDLMLAVGTTSSGNTASTLTLPHRSTRNKSLPPASTSSAACGPSDCTSYGFESGRFGEAAVCGL